MFGSRVDVLHHDVLKLFELYMSQQHVIYRKLFWLVSGLLKPPNY